MKFKFFLLLLVFVFLVALAIMNGPVSLEFSTIFGFTPSSLLEGDNLTTILNYRWAKIITAITACGGLAIAGLLMQTYFQNPLAGPDVFGLTSGASLGVALSIFAQSYLFQFTSLELNLIGFSLEALAAFLGAVVTFFLITILSKRFRSRTVLLITGLLMSSFLSGFISLLVSLSSKDELRDFISWGLGSFEKLSFTYAITFFVITVILSLLIFLMSTALNLFYLGEGYAESSGLDVRIFKKKIIFFTCFLTALVTAACGPLAFVGVVSSHVARAFFKTSDHRILIPATLVFGANLGLMVVVFLSLNFSLPLPANAIMGFIGAPLLLFMILKKEQRAN